MDTGMLGVLRQSEFPTGDAAARIISEHITGE
jgi:hypothetical protein